MQDSQIKLIQLVYRLLVLDIHDFDIILTTEYELKTYLNVDYQIEDNKYYSTNEGL